jgi:plasmid stabilization system protein ParE
MRAYLMELDQTIARLGQAPLSIGIDRSVLKPGLRSVLHGKEYIVFYRVRDEEVEIIRVLHQRQDWMRRMQPRGSRR